MNLLDPATDWRNQTNEERAEACIAFLHVANIGIEGRADMLRALNVVRARADLQRDERAA